MVAVNIGWRSVIIINGIIYGIFTNIQNGNETFSFETCSSGMSQYNSGITQPSGKSRGITFLLVYILATVKVKVEGLCLLITPWCQPFLRRGCNISSCPLKVMGLCCLLPHESDSEVLLDCLT
jgi:hypothetical protein